MCSIFDWMGHVCGSMATTKSENIHQCNMSQTCQETDFLPNGYQNVLVVIWALLHTELLLLLVYISMTSVFKIQGQGSSGSRNCILISKLFWPTVRQNCSSDREKLVKFEAEDPRIFKIFEVTRTIYSNSERSEQFLVTGCLFSLGEHFLL